jgi:hypothetical protein
LITVFGQLLAHFGVHGLVVRLPGA